jgi:hypothetical protein
MSVDGDQRHPDGALGRPVGQAGDRARAWSIQLPAAGVAVQTRNPEVSMVQR